MAPSSRQPGTFGVGGWKACPHGGGTAVGQKGLREESEPWSHDLGLDLAEVTAGPRAFGWVAWGFT